MKKVIEISGVGLVNKGAGLMLAEIALRLRAKYGDDIRMVSRPSVGSNYKAALTVAQMGVLPLAEIAIRGVEFGRYLNYLPSKLIAPFGVSRSKDVDVMLDASGLKYSDDWGVATIENGERAIRAKFDSGVRVVLMPQAFGPFNSIRSRELMLKIIDMSELIYARDECSYDYLRELSESPKIRRCADITIGCDCRGVSDSKLTDETVLMVPNQRMCDKGEEKNRKVYLDFMLKLGGQLLERGCRVQLLNHEGSADRELCEYLKSELKLETDILEFEEPRLIKHHIGGAKAVITSRFHGAVSALSQSVPCFATSWNHKYKMLFQDFGLEENVLDICADEEVRRVVDLVTNEDQLTSMSSVLRAKKAVYLSQLDQMWDEVNSLIDN